MGDEQGSFLSYLGSEKGLSKNTLIAYKADLDTFFSHTKKPLSQISEKTITTFLSAKRASGLSPSSLTRLLITLKVFFRFLRKEGLLSHNPTELILTPKVWQLIPEILTITEVETLLSAPDIEDKIGARDKAILELLYATGIRVSELCSLSLQDVGDESIRVIGKGSKERLVPIGKPAIKAIDHYLLNFRGDSKGSLFLSSKNKPLDRISIWRRIKHYAKKSAIERPISPHTLRHSFATHLLENGADLRIIQEMLGHASVATTDRYTQISGSHLKAAFSAHHPRP